MIDLKSLYKNGAELCLNEGLAVDGEPGGEIHQWVMQNCSYRPGTDFFIVLGICCEMADIQAQMEGFESQGHRAAAIAYRVVSIAR